MRQSRFRAFTALLAASLFSANASCGRADVTSIDVESVSMRISEGQVDRENRSVVALAVQIERGVSLCTGTLIAPNLILTAQHCLAPGPDQLVICGESTFGDPYPPDTVFFAFDTFLSQRTQWFGAREVLVPAAPSDVCGADIALVVSDRTVPANLALPVVPRIDVPVQRLEPYAAVGYGVTSDQKAGAGTRRMRDELQVSCGIGDCGSAVNSTEFGGDTGVCEGDSGGPALDTNGRLLGVASRGGPACTAPIYSAVSAWGDFIRQAALSASLSGGYAPESWVLTGTSDAPLPPAREDGSEPEPPSTDGGFVEPTPLPGADGAQNERCAQDADCVRNFRCLEGLEAIPFCARICSDTSDCAGSLVCEAGYCLEEELASQLELLDAGDSSGCQLGPTGIHTGVPTWWGAALMTLVFCRRHPRRGFA